MVGLVITRIHVSPSLISLSLGAAIDYPLANAYLNGNWFQTVDDFRVESGIFQVAWVAGGSALDFWSIFLLIYPPLWLAFHHFFWVGTPSGKTPVGYHNSCTVRAVFPAPAPAAAAAQEAHGCSGVRMSGVFCSMSPSPTPHWKSVGFSEGKFGGLCVIQPTWMDKNCCQGLNGFCLKSMMWFCVCVFVFRRVGLAWRGVTKNPDSIWQLRHFAAVLDQVPRCSSLDVRASLVSTSFRSPGWPRELQFKCPSGTIDLMWVSRRKHEETVFGKTWWTRTCDLFFIDFHSVYIKL